MEQGSQNSQASAEETSMEAATVKRKALLAMEKDPKKKLFLRGRQALGVGVGKSKLRVRPI
jgi:hypothetical protein